MNSDAKMGLGVVAIVALCCAGPVVLSLLASGAILGAMSAIWATDRPLFLSAGAMLIALGAGLLSWRFARSRARSRRRDTPAGSPPRTTQVSL